MALLALKVALFFLAAAFASPVSPNLFQSYAPAWPSQHVPPWALRFACMDASQYLGLALNGYHAGDSACAFFPAWPELLGVLHVPSTAYGPVLAAGIAALIWSAGLRILYIWILETRGAHAAWAAVAVFLVHPSSMFFWLGFTESLFLFLCIVFLTKCESNSKSSLAFATLACLLLPLTRAVGAFVVLVPLMWLLLGRDGMGRRAALYISAVAVGCVLYLVFFHVSTGNSFEGIESQSRFVNQPSLSHLLQPVELLRRFVGIDDLHSPTGSFLDRGMFVLGVVLLVPLARFRPEWVPWATAMLVVPAFTNWFLSCSRFTSTNLPLCLAAATVLPRIRRGWLTLLAAEGLLLQGWLLARYFAFEWGS